MHRLILIFVDIALHRRGPEDLPSSQFLFLIILGTYFFVGLFVLQIRESFSQALGLVLFDGILYLFFVWALLGIRGYLSRFIQTATALLGTEILLNLIVVPLLLWIEIIGGAAPPPILPALLFSLIFFWGIDIAGFVLSKALQLTYFVGVLIMVGYFLASFSLRSLLFSVAS
ncbi:MAG: hypothetical protein VX225_03800 [Pseudomonadota bacterium]|nr:hypothetical protein [Pseudomonadota bacterium]